MEPLPIAAMNSVDYQQKEELEKCDPFECSRTTAWKDVVQHGRYAELFGKEKRRAARSKRNQGYRNTIFAADPALDYQVDKRDKHV